MAEVMRRERMASSHEGKQNHQAVKGLNASLASSASGNKRQRDYNDLSTRDQPETKYIHAAPTGDGTVTPVPGGTALAAPAKQQEVRQKSQAELAAAAEKKRKLANMYG
jgi:hypothetical protein